MGSTIGANILTAMEASEYSEQHITRKILLVKRPVGMRDENCFKFRTSAMPEAAKRRISARTRFISVVPSMRRRMDDQNSYVPPFQLSEVINGGVVGEVGDSNSNISIKGEIVVGHLVKQVVKALDGDEIL
jgi:hypothetical protein